jgi:hypothetical protein
MSDREKTTIKLAYAHANQDFTFILNLKSATHVRRLTDTLMWACRNDIDVVITPHADSIPATSKPALFATSTRG